MTANCYRISEGPELNRCEYHFAVDAVRQKHTKVWIDILDADAKELEEKLDELNVQGLIRQFCLDSRDHPGFYPLKPLALMVIPVQMEVQDSHALEYLALIFSNDFLVSIRSSKMARFRKSISSRDSFDLLPDDSIAGIWG
jgi:hypothetical protein